MTGLLARLAARGAGRPLAGAPAKLAAPVRPRFAPPETGVARETGESLETDTTDGPAAPVIPRHEAEDEPRMRIAPDPSIGERRSDSPRDGQARSDVSPAQTDVSSHSNRIAGPTVDWSRPAPPGIAAPVPERDVPARSAAPEPPSASPGNGGEPPPRTGEPPKHDSDQAPRPAPEPQTEPQTGEHTSDMGAPGAPGRDVQLNDGAAQAAGTFVPQRAAMHDTPQAFDPVAAEAPTDPPPARLSIGRIDVIFEAPQPPPAPRRRIAPERTRGFAGFDRARLGLRR